MKKPVGLAAVGIAVSLVVALTACSTGARVDLGDDSSGNLVAAIAGEPDANLELRPALAESWDVSPDQLSWTFHLRRGVTFHDGSPFTADDVVYSYRRVIDQKLAKADKLSAITGVTASDRRRSQSL